jgi:hypothetical protein
VQCFKKCEEQYFTNVGSLVVCPVCGDSLCIQGFQSQTPLYLKAWRILCQFIFWHKNKENQVVSVKFAGKEGGFRAQNKLQEAVHGASNTAKKNRPFSGSVFLK